MMTSDWSMTLRRWLMKALADESLSMMDGSSGGSSNSGSGGWSEAYVWSAVVLVVAIEANVVRARLAALGPCNGDQRRAPSRLS